MNLEQKFEGDWYRAYFMLNIRGGGINWTDFLSLKFLFCCLFYSTGSIVRSYIIARISLFAFLLAKKWRRPSFLSVNKRKCLP